MDVLQNVFQNYKFNLRNLKDASSNLIINGILTIMVIILFVYWWRNKNVKKYKLPPGPRGAPILGYLPFLGKEPFRDFDKLSKKYGNVMSVYLGQSYVVILGNFEAVKEALSKNSTLNRPEGLFDFLPDGVGFSSVNDTQWVEQRRFSVKAMRDLGLGRSKWEYLVQEELDDFIKLIYSFKGKPNNVFRFLALSVSNNMSSLLFGRRLPLNDKNLNFVTNTLDKLFSHFSQANWSHYFPVLHNIFSKVSLNSLSTSRKEFEAFNNFIREQVEVQKKTYTPGSTDNFVHEFLTEIKKNESKESGNKFDESVLRGNLQALFLGGSDTTSLSLSWLLLCMAKYRDIQQKVHQELDTVLGRDGKIQYSERFKVPYTLAVIMEEQRYRTLAPLNTSRIASEDIKIQGYDIPRGTVIIGNNWGLHHDTRYWKEPEKFMPERFLSNDGKQVNVKQESYVPFSYGKRGCPGETVAYIEILSYFVAIMQNFEVLPPENKAPIMEGILGLTYATIPQELRFIARR
ncbi:cytochrome P450 2J4 [Parasteatoda tepidariorum]|uniref:cytochrome P450 2J4 n=1 Tax=Parasteatoda tepidariorum TaxID=114398 RepID=UPI00077F8E8A|nr:cytochrome P450 2J4 [Parasteatoda tepidariorum]